MPRASAGYASAGYASAGYASAAARPAAGPAGTAVLAVLGLAAALTVRVGLAGPAGARSATAGLVFGGLLVAVSLGLAGPHRPASARPASGVAVGLAGAAVLCLPVLATSYAVPPMGYQHTKPPTSGVNIGAAARGHNTSILYANSAEQGPQVSV